MNRAPTDAEKTVAAAIMQHLGGNQAITGCQYKLAQAAIRALREAPPEVLTPIACLIAPEDLPDDVDEHPRRLTQCAAEVAHAWGASIDAASPPEPI